MSETTTHHSNLGVSTSVTIEVIGPYRVRLYRFYVPSSEGNQHVVTVHNGSQRVDRWTFRATELEGATALFNATKEMLAIRIAKKALGLN